MIFVNVINNENLNRFSSLETVKLTGYGIKEIDRELFEI